MKRLNRSIKATTLAGAFAAAVALGLAGAIAPTAQASDACDVGGTVVAAPSTATTGALVFQVHPALAGQPCVILAVDANTGAVAPVGEGFVVPDVNVMPVPMMSDADYIVVTPEGPIWAGKVDKDDGTIIG